ncbi:hypothetical protein glysoja_025703 [Glycine soja]|uniref:Uncharacterized protein n=1 Tax=Glycine soja TaxID=3848 RepID=A0A0B2R9T8_GLYSO|nr:hypothetical protein glysoja_025703 [Glycine soja]
MQKNLTRFLHPYSNCRKFIITISQLSSVLNSFILDKGVLKYPSTSNFFGLNSLYFANCSLASSFLSSKL